MLQLMRGSYCSFKHRRTRLRSIRIHEAMRESIWRILKDMSITGTIIHSPDSPFELLTVESARQSLVFGECQQRLPR